MKLILWACGISVVFWFVLTMEPRRAMAAFVSAIVLVSISFMCEYAKKSGKDE